MCDPDEELRDWGSPERRIDEPYEQFLISLDGLVRSYWLMKTLNLHMFPEELHAPHRERLAHATDIALALRKIGRSHPDVLAPRTAQFLNRLFPTEADAIPPQMLRTSHESSRVETFTKTSSPAEGETNHERRRHLLR